MKKIKKLIWFITKPQYFFILYKIIKSKIFSVKENNNKSLKLCKKKQITYKNFKKKFFSNKIKNYNLNKLINLNQSFILIKKNTEMLKKAQNFGKKNIKLNINNFMQKSGSSNIKLLYELIRDKKPKNILETGVAYGWSSYAILLSIKQNKLGKLISIDLPYPLINEKKNIGILVPNNLQKKWKLLFCRDTIGISKALKKFNYKIDLLHYDSDKNYDSKIKNLYQVWKYLTPNGIIICDDINDNYAFFDFVNKIKKKYYVIKSGNKFLGIVANDKKN